MLGSDCIKENTIYYKYYQNFMLYFAIDAFSVVCIVECLHENRILYVGDTLPVNETNDLVLNILNNIVDYDVKLSNMTSNYTDISLFLESNHLIESN